MLNRLGFDNRFGRVAATYDMSPRGNGYLVPILPKTDFSFDGRNVANATQDVPVAVGIDSSSWVSGALIVRLHAKNTWSATASLRVFVDNIMLAPEEPDVVFATSPVVELAFASFVNTDAAPLLKVATLTGMGPMLRVMVRWTQGLTAGAGQQTGAIGIDLVGRPA